MKKLSIVVPVYNVEKYLNKCINSILNQTFRDFELILIDDGSTDASSKICEYYITIDTRVKLLKTNHIGVGQARNIGIANSDGEYVAFIDSDDWLDVSAYETVFKVLESSNCDLLMFGNIDVLYDKNERKILNQNKIVAEREYLSSKEIRDNFCYLLFNTQFNVPWNKIYKLSIIKNNNILFPEYVRAQDAFFNMDYLKKAQSLKIIPDILYYYRVNDKYKVWKKFPKNLIEIDISYDKYVVDMLTEWHQYFGKNKNKIDNLFVNSVYKTIGFYRNPLWGMNRKEKNAYIYGIINREYVIERFKKIEYKLNENKIVAILDGNIKKIKKYIKYETRKNNFLESRLFKFLRKLKRAIYR